jgi:hypothetical protein
MWPCEYHNNRCSEERESVLPYFHFQSLNSLRTNTQTQKDPTKNMKSAAALIALFISSSKAFTPMASSKPTCFRPSTLLREGSIEQIEFKIYPDGRIEETVRGVKGGNCQKITEEINKVLGKTVDSKPTEEMFEEKINIEQTVSTKTSSNGDNSWDGASSW